MAMYHFPFCVTNFLVDHDQCIESAANSNSTSWYYVRSTYEVPPGQTNAFLFGYRNSKVS